MHTRAIESIESSAHSYLPQSLVDSFGLFFLGGGDKDEVDDDSERTSSNGCASVVRNSIWPVPLAQV